MKKINVAKLIRKAIEFEKMQHLYAAKEIYIDILKAYPGNKKVKLKLSKLENSPEMHKEANAHEIAISECKRLLRLGKAADVIDNIGVLLKRYPNSIELLLLTSQAYFMVKDLNAAHAFLRRALLREPRNPIVNNNLSVILRLQNKIDDAIAISSMVSNEHPDYIDGHLNLAYALILKRDFEAAIRSFVSVVKLDLNFDSVYTEIAKLITSLSSEPDYLSTRRAENVDEYVSMRDDCQENANSLTTLCNELRITTNPQEYMQNAYRLKNEGYIEEAISSYIKAIALNRNNSEGLIELGWLFFGQENYSQALIAFKNASIVDPKLADIYYAMGAVLERVGKIAEAVSNFETALLYSPQHRDTLFALASVYMTEKKYLLAKALLERANKVDTSNVDIFLNLASVNYYLGDVDKAIEILELAHTKDPKRVDVLYNLGTILIDMGKYSGAIKKLHLAISLDSKKSELHNSMGLALFDCGDLDDAESHFLKALEIDPENVEAINNLSFCKLSRNNFAEAFQLRKSRFQTKIGKSYDRVFNVPEWNGSTPIDDKTLLVWGEQGPGDMVIWASCLGYYAGICKKLILECPSKLMPLFRTSFPNIVVRDATLESKSDFDLHIPFEGLFGLACQSSVVQDTQESYIRPDRERKSYWYKRLRRETPKPCVGISWKSPVMNHSRSKNYLDLQYWKQILSTKDVTFINLQSGDFEGDFTLFCEDWGVEILHFTDIDHFNNLNEVAALASALDIVVSVPTALSTITAAIGTKTIIPTWRQSSWNNILFNSRGPQTKLIFWDTGDDFTEVIEQIIFEITELKNNSQRI